MKKVIGFVLCLAMVASLFGCSVSFRTEVNLRDKLSSLMVTDEAAGVKGKYTALSEISDGSVDKDLVGTWKTADGKTSYTYSEDGTVKASTEYGDNEAKFTCLNAGDYALICEELQMTSTDESGNETASTVISYSSYLVENDVLYFTTVEDTTDENMDSSQYALIVMYRADENGSTESAMAKTNISLDSFAGTWVCEKGEITIDDGKLTCGDDEFDIAMNDKGQLTVERDGEQTAYAVNISVRKQYDDADKTQSEETTAMGLYYTGVDETHKPNLLAVMDDWKAEYQWETCYYSAVFDLQQ